MINPATTGSALSNSSSLVSRLKAKEPDAWTRLARLYGPLVYGWARRAGLQDGDAADVAQLVFQAVIRRIDGFQRQSPGGSFCGWLRGIARHKIADHYRAKANRAEVIGGSALAARCEYSPESFLETSQDNVNEVRELARRAMDLIRLDFQETTWRAFWRTAIDQCAPAEVARELNISVASVYSAKSRVLARLRDELADPSA